MSKIQEIMRDLYTITKDVKPSDENGDYLFSESRELHRFLTSTKGELFTALVRAEYVLYLKNWYEENDRVYDIPMSEIEFEHHKISDNHKYIDVMTRDLWKNSSYLDRGGFIRDELLCEVVLTISYVLGLPMKYCFVEIKADIEGQRIYPKFFCQATTIEGLSSEMDDLFTWIKENHGKL